MAEKDLQAVGETAYCKSSSAGPGIIMKKSDNRYE